MTELNVDGANAGKNFSVKARCRYAISVLLLLSGCGGGDGTQVNTPAPAPVNAEIAISVIGLRPGQQIILNNSGSDSLTVDASGTFKFSRVVAKGANYSVTVATTPTAETCTLENASGVVQSAATITVKLNCSPTILHSFTGPDGSSDANEFTLTPNVMVASDGNIYGTVVKGGTFGFGTVFKMTPAGNLTVLHHFDGSTSDGSFPEAALVEGPGGDLYGTTVRGGDFNIGTIFKISRSGVFTLLHSFHGGANDGAFPKAELTQDAGDLYGTSQSGGQFDRGTVFKLTSAGTIVVQHSFGITDGDLPSAPLVQDSAGNFYGTTSQGGTNGGGRVFKITKSGTLTSLHDFNGVDGLYLYGRLLVDLDGNVYGTTYSATPGPPTGTVGNVFKITASGEYAVLHQFAGSDGSLPVGGLTWGQDGSVYGTTSWGGKGDDAYGVIFRVTVAGDFSLLHSFQRSSGGHTPRGPLAQAPSGIFYGTTSGGGAGNMGTIFKY